MSAFGPTHPVPMVRTFFMDDPLDLRRLPPHEQGPADLGTEPETALAGEGQVRTEGLRGRLWQLGSKHGHFQVAILAC